MRARKSPASTPASQWEHHSSCIIIYAALYIFSVTCSAPRFSLLFFFIVHVALPFEVCPALTLPCSFTSSRVLTQHAGGMTLKMETKEKKYNTACVVAARTSRTAGHCVSLQNTRMSSPSLCRNMFLCADLLTSPDSAPAVIRRQNCKG